MAEGRWREIAAQVLDANNGEENSAENGREYRNRRVVAYITHAQHDRLAQIARQTGVTVSAVIAVAISDYLARREAREDKGE